MSNSLPAGWVLSPYTFVAVVDYDDPRWFEIPEEEGKYYSVDGRLTPKDFPKGDHTGRWEVRFRCLRGPDWVSKTGDSVAAIKASGLLGANRAETESVMDRYTDENWVGLGCPRPSGLMPYIYYDATNNNRSLSLEGTPNGFASGPFLLICERREIE